MKFTRRLDPGSLDLANLRVNLRAEGCRHCHLIDTLVGHGFLRGLAPTGSSSVTRGLRMWCSRRDSNRGCGRTFSIHWEDCIPNASLRTFQLVTLLRALAAAPTRHAAHTGSGLESSLTGAYRWLARWERGAARLLTWLCPLADPPPKTDGLPDPYLLRHLDSAFPAAGCPAAAFQNRFQIPLIR